MQVLILPFENPMLPCFWTKKRVPILNKFVPNVIAQITVFVPSVQGCCGMRGPKIQILNRWNVDGCITYWQTMTNHCSRNTSHLRLVYCNCSTLAGKMSGGKKNNWFSLRTYLETSEIAWNNVIVFSSLNLDFFFGFSLVKKYLNKLVALLVHVIYVVHRPMRWQIYC